MRSCIATVSRVELATAASICAEVGDRPLVGDLQRGDDGVGDPVVDVVGEAGERRGQLAALRPHVERLDLVADRRRRDPGRLADRLVQAGVGHQQVAEHLRPRGDRLRAGELPPAPGAQADERREQPTERRRTRPSRPATASTTRPGPARRRRGRGAASADRRGSDAGTVELGGAGRAAPASRRRRRRPRSRCRLRAGRRASGEEVMARPPSGRVEQEVIVEPDVAQAGAAERRRGAPGAGRGRRDRRRRSG